MHRVWATLLVAGALPVVPCRVSTQEAKPALTGRWLLDRDAIDVAGGGRGDASGNASGGGGRGGGGIGLGPPGAELIIQQSDSTLHMVVMKEDGSGAVILYRLNGKATKVPLPTGRGQTAEATYSSRWNRDRLETAIVRKLVARGTTTELRYREQLYLSSDSVLVIETTMTGRSGGRKAFYRKAKE
ncbi:MAG: hypothetical protein WEE89_17965 [Gemmatimonadota bacterium]